MTEDQKRQLNDALLEIEQRACKFTIPLIEAPDTAEANRVISEARIKIHQLDIELFGCLRMLERFMDANRPKVVGFNPPKAKAKDDLASLGLVGGHSMEDWKAAAEFLSQLEKKHG